MKKFVKILFGGAILSYALSTIAMEPNHNEEGGSPNTKKIEIQQPLKFKVDPMTGNVEDAEGSYLILQYRSAVRDLCAGCGALRDTAQLELNELEVALREMPKDSEDYFATEIYKNKLVSKIYKFQKKASDTIDEEQFFRKLLNEIYKGTTPSSGGGCSISLPVPNYELLSSIKFQEMKKLDFSCHSGPFGISKLGKYCIGLEINCNFPSPDIHNEFYQTLQYGRNNWKLIEAQKEIFKKSKLIYRLSTKTEHKLDFEERFLLKAAQDIAQANQKPATQFLKEEMDALIYKAENIYIPGMAPQYYFAKAVMAFCEEVDHHRPTK